MKHVNVALFVPHAGCPNQCSFCNQRMISGTQNQITPEEVEEACRIAVETKRADAAHSEIAFFGGSFTAIKRDYMVSLLAAAKPFLDKGYFKGIRISTRPDCIDEEILDILKAYGVTAIELGAQSMDEEVLCLNRRGHTAKDVEAACALIKAYGFSLGLQMMTGLLGSSDAKDIETAEKICALKPDTVRIYPTIVLEGTYLAECLKNGSYKAETLETAVPLCAKLLCLFKAHNIRVIRLGLHSGGNVEEGYLGGAYHPAFRELCEGEVYKEIMLRNLEGRPKNKPYLIEVPQNALSKAKGQGKRNEKALRNCGFQCIIKGNEFLNEYEINIKDLNYDFKVAGDAGI